MMSDGFYIEAQTWIIRAPFEHVSCVHNGTSNNVLPTKKPGMVREQASGELFGGGGYWYMVGYENH